MLLFAAVVGYCASSVQAQVCVAEDGVVFETCSGTFHDSGGPTTNYSNNEDITTTICPAGGAGAGPFSSVVFMQWNVAPGPGDELRIYDGPDTGGPPMAVGSAANSLLNLTFTATHPSGCLTFRWLSNGSGTAAGWTARIITGPNAGENASITVCSSDAPFFMRLQLGGTPTPGGSWTGPGGAPHSFLFDPQVDPAGVYTYTVSGPAPCPDSVATLTIAKVSAPNAGSNSSISLCSDGASVDLFTVLGGSPQPGGSWAGPDGPHSGEFDPASDTPGLYVYTVLGTPPCADVSATVSVTVNQRPDAGGPATVTVCSNQAAFPLFGALAGSPDAGGAWSLPGPVPVSGTYTPGSSAPGVYTYTVLGLPPCASSSATVTVVEVAAPNPGGNRSITVCSDLPAFSLLGQLAGSPQAGGTWLGPNGPHGDTFDPASDDEGAYTYTVQGNAPCANASAVLTITLRQAPNAGSDAAITVCDNDGSFSLFGMLGGAPNVGGTWTDPDGLPFSGTFVPGTDPAGDYTYTVVGQAPCTPAFAIVSVSVNTAPNAGSNASTVRCSNDAPFSLFDLLGGNADPNGTWAGPGGVHSGTFIPGTDAPGPYIYTVEGLPPCEPEVAVVNVSIVVAPNAGTDASLDLCINDAPVNLTDQLGGTPSQTGTWADPDLQPFGGVFDPGTALPGVYTYTVQGAAPCANAVALLELGVIPAPDAGTNGSITVCSNNAPVDLFEELGGTPDQGGTWTRPGGTSHSGTYFPAFQPSGTYTYTVTGNAPCANASSSVQVVRVQAPNAGVDGFLTVCSTNGSFELLSVLGGNPNGGGTWINDNDQTVPGTFVPGTTAPGVYRYVLLGTIPCANDTSTVTVNVNSAPNAGVNTSITVCSSDDTFDLLGVLAGSPDANGTWTGPGGPVPDGLFVPGISVPGGYTYQVAGQTPCLNASAVLVVNVNQQPVAGTGGAFEVCNTQAPVDLFTLLGGTPQGGGSWEGPSGPTNSIFFPASSPSGNYTYTVVGVAPCTNANAILEATVNDAPDAGVSGEMAVCAGSPPVSLFDGLSGDPDLNGTWTEDSPTGQLSGEFFNPIGLPPGVYGFTYTVPAIGPCPEAVSTVQVTIVPALNAGTNGSITVCSSSTSVNLFSGLGGNPQLGGQWLDLSGTGALSGSTFNASLAGAGVYVFRYRLSGSVACDADSAQTQVTVNQAPNAGCNSTAVLCSDSGPTALFPFINCGPTGGGTWTRNGESFSGTFNPTTHSPSDIIQYRVGAPTPCDAAIITVTVQLVPAANAGLPNDITVCSTSPEFNMTAQLGGTPAPGGAWTFNNLPHGPNFVPGLDQQGVYVYTVTGAPPCANKSSSLTISVTPAAFAGVSGSRTVCSTDGPFLLYDVLGGQPQFNGQWIGPDLLPYPTGTYTPGTSEPGDYLYVVTGSGICAGDTAVVSIFENTAPNAGLPSSITLCNTGAGGSIILFGQLGGTPDPGGTWVGPAPLNPPFTGTFVLGVSQPGVYTYTVNGVFPCPATVSSSVTVGVSGSANAGISNTIQVCRTEPAFAMVDRLLGSPALNGAWVGPAPGNPPSNGVFNPLAMGPGTYVYTYTVPSAQPCPNVSSTLTITVFQEPNAGVDANTQICSSSGAVNLFPLLGTSAQLGGTWHVQGTGAPFSGTFLPTVNTTGTYVYTVQGQGSCPSDSALVSVVLNQAPNAGIGGPVTFCSNANPVLLFTLLTNSPASNGVWSGPGAVPGIFQPGIDPPGTYTYTVPGLAGCNSASAFLVISVNPATNAGSSATRSVCSTDGAIDLLAQLGGSPQGGGTWTGPSGAGSTGTYVPGTDLPGVYTYRITGLAPCTSDSATVTINEVTAPVAGFPSVAQICSDTIAFALVDLLTGNPDLVGAWTFNNDPHGPVFDPASDVSGIYVYTVTGTTPCPNAVAQVQVVLVPAPNAGNNAQITACSGDAAIDLFAALGPNAQTGGSWTDTNDTGGLSGNFFNTQGLPPGSYLFIYTVPGTSPCGSASASVTVNISDALNAGDDSTVEVCESQGNVDVFAAIGGAPQTGGFCVDVNGSGALIGCVFNASAVVPGTTWEILYVLPANSQSQCQSDTARVSITVLDGPNAGCSAGANICSSQTAVNLASLLQCNADQGGFWLDPVFGPSTGSFDPLTDLPGNYYYVVPAVGSCPSDTAVVPINLVQAPNAGNDASISICSSDAPIDLFTLLGANAQSGGQWFAPGNVPHVGGGIYNPIVDGPGIYRYRVLGQLPCSATDDAFVTVSEPQAVNAGVSSSVALCSNQAQIFMRDFLGGSPQGGGTWVGPDEPHGNFFNPATHTPGNYVYTVVGVAPCPSASATLSIAVAQLPVAGVDGSAQACITQTELDLYPILGPTAQTGGNWSGPIALNGSVLDPSQLSPGVHVFTYSFPAVPPCSGASSQVAVTVGEGLSAGDDAVVEICGAEINYPLIEGLGGSPSTGGTWTDLIGAGGLQPDGTLNATLLTPGVTGQYGYTVVDPGCGSVSSVLTLSVSEFPDPGVGGELVLCSISDAVQLFDVLTGTPQAGGTWSDPQGNTFDGAFTPGTNAPGPYRYLVAGNSVCADSSATVNVVVNTLPNAGSDATVVLCDTLFNFPLISALGGSPQTGGAWSALNGAGGLNGEVLNTSVLAAGSYVYLYTVSAPGCPGVSARLTVEVKEGVDVVDLSTVCDPVSRTYTVSFVIQGGDPGTYAVNGLEGELSTGPVHRFTSVPVITSSGFEVFVTDGYGCAVVRVEGSSPCAFDDDVFVPEAFSPNNDGINDAFVIPGIEGYPDNRITIFNRWGGKMYEAAGYNNRSVVWDGTSPDGLYSGLAPSGTYFYVLDLGTGREALTGYIYLNR